MTVRELPVIPVEWATRDREHDEPEPPPQTGRRLRTSSYTIYVDLPNSSTDMLLVHGYTGAFDRVSQRIATYLRSLEVRRPIRPLYGQWTPEPAVHPNEVVPPPPESIALLKRRGYLTELTTEDEEALLSRVATRLHELASRKPNYIFMPTYDCNLRCFYCFQDHMRTDPAFRHLLRGMTPALVDRIFVGMQSIEAMHGLGAGDVDQRTIGFFGGEPLLAGNRPIVEHVMRRALELGRADFWAVSNGTDLDSYADLLGPERLARIQITLDGTPEEHDRRRVYADGHGSFERIARNITMALELGTQITVRLNVDRDNIDMLPALAEEMIRRGWDRYPGWSCYTAPIHAANEKTNRKTTYTSWELDKALSERRLLQPSMRVIDRPDDRLKDQARTIFSNQGAPMLRAEFCGAHSSMYIFDAFADVYACWERTGDSRIRIGRVADDGSVDLNDFVQKAWRARSVAGNPICRKCRYALLCGGGCAVLAEGRRGTLSANFCDGYAARFRAMVAEAYVEHAAGVAHVARGGRLCDL